MGHAWEICAGISAGRVHIHPSVLSGGKKIAAKCDRCEETKDLFPYTRRDGPGLLCGTHFVFQRVAREITRRRLNERIDLGDHPEELATGLVQVEEKMLGALDQFRALPVGAEAHRGFANRPGWAGGTVHYGPDWNIEGTVEDFLVNLGCLFRGYSTSDEKNWGYEVTKLRKLGDLERLPLGWRNAIPGYLWNS
jgi:hypothetical protein